MPKGRLSAGTRIRFIKELYAPADDHSPAGFYAHRNQLGVVVGHNCREGHQVRRDDMSGKPGAWFGAILGEEFVAYEVQPKKGHKKSGRRGR